MAASGRYTVVLDACVLYPRLLRDVLKLPDPDDRHVLAAAIRGNADAIVTFNTRHFPIQELTKFDVELQTPDQFVLNQVMLHPISSSSGNSPRPPRT